MTLPSTGLHYGVPFETYRQWPAVNVSTLKPMRRTPLHCRWAMEHPRETDELNVGSALHVACFEPARFDKEFYLGREEYKLNTKEGKAVHEREIAEAAGRTYIRRKAGEAVDCESVLGMQHSLWAYRPSKKFLQMPGQCEVCAIWQDTETGLMCKARFDKLVPSANTPFKRPVIVELKSTRDGSEFGFARDVHKLGYDMQAAFYCWGIRVVTGEEPLHIFLGVENSGPYAAFCGALDDMALQVGKGDFRRCLDRFAECQVLDEWPGYTESVRTIRLPGWVEYETESL
jgi:hypothetical protein